MVLAAAFALAFAVPMARAITIENYRKWSAVNRPLKASARSILEVRLEGVYAGLVLADRMNRKRGGSPLFCPPDTVVPSGKMVREMVDTEIDRPSDRSIKAYPADTAVELLVLTAARHRWPCTGR